MADHETKHNSDHKVALRTVKPRSFEDEMKAEGFDHGDKKKLPEMSFDFALLPEAKDWENEEPYRIVIEGNQVGHRNVKGKGSVTIAVAKIGGEHIERSGGKRFSRRKKND